MAKTSKIVRNKKRIVASERYRAKKNELRAIMNSPSTSLEEKEAARAKMNRIPRLGLGNRVVNRCELTGRPRGVLQKFKLSRIAFRELANTGMIPGVTKSSW